MTILGFLACFLFFCAFQGRETTGEKITFGLGVLLFIGVLGAVLFLAFCMFVSAL